MPTDPDPRAGTLDAVAAAAGVSRATVSRVVNGGSRVSPDTRRAVERAIERLGYTPNPAARALATRRTDAVALVIPEPASRLFGHPFFSHLVAGMGHVLAGADKQLVLLAPQSEPEEARTLRYVTAARPDGVLLVSLHGSDPLPSELARRGIPVVVGGRPPVADVPYVDVDNVGGARSAVEHLVAGGRRTIATITGPLDMSSAADRLDGYRAALRAAGLRADPSLEASGGFDQDQARDAMLAMLGRRPDLDAVFAASDLMAAGALQALRRSGRRVPDDVAIVGYDDSVVATWTEPPLSTVRQPMEEMGRTMARLLLETIEPRARDADRRRDEPRREILPTELVVRASSLG